MKTQIVIKYREWANMPEHTKPLREIMQESESGRYEGVLERAEEKALHAAKFNARLTELLYNKGLLTQEEIRDLLECYDCDFFEYAHIDTN